MIVKIKGNKLWVTVSCILMLVLILTTVVNVTSPDAVTTENKSNSNLEHLNSKVDFENIRGVWVPYFSLETKNHTESQFKDKFDKIVKIAVENKMNTLVVHIRPFSDALYKSKIFPSSHIVAGTQGKAIDYDPLEYMITTAHKNGLKFHAWINPYRISTSDTPTELAENSIANTLEEEDIIEYSGGKYINPASHKGRKLIIDGVREIIENYDVDGLQFDDYFYPTSETELDRASYEEYRSNLDTECVPLTQYEWRMSNVNMLISSVYSVIKQEKPNVVFGISPQGNLDNCMDIGADVTTWCNTYGYIDYICPQLYVNFEHSTLPFDTMLKQWLDISKNSKVSLCIGLALYKANSDYDDGTWKNSDSILKQQVKYCQDNNINNFMIYDIDYFTNENTSQEVANVTSVL